MPIRYVLRDPDLPHQIHLVFVGLKVHVTCNCLRRGQSHGCGYETMGPAPTVEEAWKLYNNPDNHREPWPVD